MAKSRKTSSKSGARKTTRRRPRRVKAPKSIELRPIRKQLEAHKKTLGRTPQTRQIKAALRRIERCLAAINDICGPDMNIPLP